VECQKRVKFVKDYLLRRVEAGPQPCLRFLFLAALTSLQITFYHPQRWGEAKLADDRSFSQRNRKGTSYSILVLSIEGIFLDQASAFI
jgi:hypothetical protein